MVVGQSVSWSCWELCMRECSCCHQVKKCIAHSNYIVVDVLLSGSCGAVPSESCAVLLMHKVPLQEENYFDCGAFTFPPLLNLCLLCKVSRLTKLVLCWLPNHLCSMHNVRVRWFKLVRNRVWSATSPTCIKRCSGSHTRFNGDSGNHYRCGLLFYWQTLTRKFSSKITQAITSLPVPIGRTRMIKTRFFTPGYKKLWMHTHEPIIHSSVKVISGALNMLSWSHSTKYWDAHNLVPV